MRILPALFATSLFVAPAALFTGPAVAQATGDTHVTAPSAIHDFDFIIGKWKVHHHRLKHRLAGDDEWEDFEGTSEVWKTLNGNGTFDENYIGIPSGGYWADGIRAYDPKTDTWAIWWLDARHPENIETPVRGRFENGVGTFEAPDIQEGKHVIVRFVWSGITRDKAHWEQAFSTDGGKTWETNWVMDLTRVK